MNYSLINLPERKLLDEEETRYFIKQAQKGDKKSLDKLVEHNLRLVLKVTYRFKNSGYDLQDLFQIGVIGLMKAIKNFDLAKNVKFSTYAVSRIIGEIRLHLRDDGMIKVSRSLKKIANEIRKKEEEMKKKLNRPPTIKELALATEYTTEEIVEALEANKPPTSIYKTIHENEGNDLYLIDSLPSDEEEKELDSFGKLELVDVLQKLDERSRKIIFMRYFEDKTQQEIADKLGISQVQVSRLERKILKQLKKILKNPG